LVFVISRCKFLVTQNKHRRLIHFAAPILSLQASGYSIYQA